MNVKELKQILNALNDNDEVMIPSKASSMDIDFYGASEYKSVKEVSILKGKIIIK